MDNPQSELCDHIIDEVCVKYLDDKRIFLIISKHNGREHTDSFMNTILDYFNQHENEKSLYMCFNISQSNYSVYGVRRFMDLHQVLGSKMRGRIAVVVKRNSIGQTMKLFAQFNLTKPVHERQFFFDESQAIEWLRDGSRQIDD